MKTLVASACLSACLAVAACAATAPQPPSTPADPAAVVAELDQVYATFSRAYAELDPDIVADLYTESALYLSPNRDIDKGRATIRESFAGMFERTRQKGESLRITFDRIDRQISGSLAYEVGYYTLVRTQADGQARTSRGKFVVVLIRGADGRWRFQVDGYSQAPAPVADRHQRSIVSSVGPVR